MLKTKISKECDKTKAFLFQAYVQLLSLGFSYKSLFGPHPFGHTLTLDCGDAFFTRKRILMKDCMRLGTRRFQEYFHDLVTEEATFLPSGFIKIGRNEVIPKKSGLQS